MQGLTRTLKERGETLKATYEQTKAANSMKMNFLSNMSDQIMEPVNEIHNRALTISNHLNELSEEETSRFVDEIQAQGGKVTSILNNVIAKSEKITN
jgi:K+-sensing histidine kinase KdpD